MKITNIRTFVCEFIIIGFVLVGAVALAGSIVALVKFVIIGSLIVIGAFALLGSLYAGYAKIK
jgi:acyl-[acyl carrier protein]--UDP-N-acetylglucosamine O-acyltransferase